MPSVKLPCFCPRCEGMLRCQDTVNNHAKLDLKEAMQKQKQSLSSYESVKLFNSAFNPELYNTHWASNTPLYEGAKISLLDYIFIEMRRYVSHPLYAKATVTEGFRNDKLFKLPEPNECPTNFVKARKIIDDFLVGLKTYHVCPQDCVIFRNEYENAKECPVCGSERYCSNGKAKKTFKYFPLSPRIARMYQDENLAKILQSHVSRKEDGFLTDILDTERWKSGWFSRNGEFKGQDGIALNFCTDGVNPLKTIGLVYSMWPLMMSVLNFPIAFRKSVGGILLLGIIPGNGRSEAKQLDPYLEIIVDELLILSECHVYYSSYMASPVTIKVRLLQYVLDFPGIAKLMKFPGSGAIRACPWCNITGVWCKHICKTIYSNKQRTVTSHNVEKEIELREEYNDLQGPTKKKRFTREHGVKGTHALLKLPYHKSHEHVQPDPMHTVKDCVEHIIEWLIGKIPVEKLRNSELVMDPSSEKDVDPLTRDEITKANERCRNLCFPKDCSGFKGNVFDHPKRVLVKTHGWTEYIAYNIWAYLLRDCLSERKRRTLIYFFWVLAKLHAKSFRKDEMDTLVAYLSDALDLLERDCPVWLGNITMHILKHLAEKIVENGPLCASWMFPYERMNSYITRRATNRSSIEECIMETIQILDWVLFATYTGKFSNMKDERNNICASASRLLHRDGEILDDYVYKVGTLDVRQLQDIGYDNNGTTVEAKFFKVIDKVEIDREDVTYRLNDIIRDGERAIYGRIHSLIEMKDKKYADCMFWVHHDTDPDTQIDFAQLEQRDAFKKLTKLPVLSSPLITAIEDNYIWFISYVKDCIPWIGEHKGL